MNTFKQSGLLGGARTASSAKFVLGASALVVVMILGIVGGLLVYLHDRAIKDAGNQMLNLSAVLAEQTARTVQSVVLVLDAIEVGLKQLEQEGAGSATMHRMLREKVHALPQIKHVTVIGPTGSVVLSSRSEPPPDLWLGDRPHFIQHRDEPGNNLLVTPLKGRSSGEWLIVLSRRLENPDGSFAGVIDMDLDPGYFEAIYASATLPGAAITLFRSDAVVLAHHPHPRGRDILGQPLFDSLVFQQLRGPNPPQVIRALGRISGEYRIFAPRFVKGYPLVVNPSISERVVLATWRSQAWGIGGGALVVSFVTVLLMVLLRAGERRVQQQAALLQDAVDAMPDGLILFDREDRLVLYNQNFRHLRPRDPAGFQIGATYENLLRDIVASGDIRIPEGEDPEAWIRRRVEVHRNPSGPIMRERNGRILRISERKTTDGGIVGVYSDITDLKHTQAELEAAHARFADWAAASNDWFWESDVDYRFTFISEGVEKATGLTPETMIGQSIDFSHLDGDPADRDARAARLAAHESFRDLVVSITHRDGRRCYVSISAKPLLDAGGRFTGYRGTGRDVTSQIEAEQELERKTKILSTLIDNLPVGATLVDRDLRFVAYNRLFLEIYDLSPDMLQIGDSFEKFIRYHAERGEYGLGDIAELTRLRVWRALDPQPHHFERRRPNGQVIEIRRVPLPGDGFVTTYIDVTEARERELELEQTRTRLEQQAQALMEARAEAERARAEADEANHAKTLFLANMSHELRTPLNAILGFSEITRDATMGPLDARYRDYAREIHASGHYLLRLINDVLDTSKVDLDRMELFEESVDLADLVGECQRLLRDRVEERNLTLATDLPSDLPPLVVDRLRLKQVLLNLMANAIKFTGEGGRVTVRARVPDQGGVEIVVNDTGIGMRPEDIPAALELFRQVENPMTRHHEGAGLGLPLAKALVELHGGKLWIESTPGLGTSVHVWLPASRVTPHEQSASGTLGSWRGR